MVREIPLFTLDGVRDAEKRSYPVTTADGLALHLQRFCRAESDDVVLLLHGLSVSSDIYIMPEHYNLVSYLLDHGYGDVWTLDFRMSQRFPYNLIPNRYSMDDCALYDMPAAIERLRELIGPERRIHVIGHCLGSMSFALALAARTVKGITSFISSSVSYTPYISAWARFKITVFPFFLERVLDMPYVSPAWGSEPRLTRGKLLSKGVSLFHPECDEPACHMLSLMWGDGRPALYSHENMDEITHRRLADLFGGTGLNYHHHVRKMVQSGNQAVRMFPDETRHDPLPQNYFVEAVHIETPILFVTGDNNKVFGDSNIRAYHALRERGATQHELVVYPGYGHQDVFMGKNVAEDTFPQMVEFLDRQRG